MLFEKFSEINVRTLKKLFIYKCYTLIFTYIHMQM